MTKPQSLRVRLALSTTMAGAMLVSYGGRNAEAGTCAPLGGGVYFCSGGAAPPEAGYAIDFAGPVTVTTSSAPPAGFGIDTTGTGDTAISIKADGGLTFDDTNTYGSIITGDDDGLYAKNENGGALTITTNGPVTGLGGDGIEASNDADGTNLTISAAGVSGEQHGVIAKNEGTGDLTITADGTVTSGESEGIDARITNASSGGDIVITTNVVNGGATGIAARHEGTGSIEITANGTVFGGLSDNASGSGISAQITNGASDSDVTITADSVNGEQVGINARNQGAGSITVTADGLVTATNVNGDGIVARNFNDGDVTVSATSVDAERFGILASNRGNGSIYVTASGTVTGRTGDGILAADPAGSNGLNVAVTAADVHGGVNGIVAQNIGTGFLSVTAGNVTGELFEGIRASLINGTDATISVGDVSAGRVGISAFNNGDGSLSITAGNVTGGLGGNGNGIVASLRSDGDNLTISAAAVTGADTGIFATSAGTGALSITTSGPVFGASEDGIFAKIDNAANGADLTISAMAVTGAVNGIQADHQGTGNIAISASGPVEGIGDDGIKIVNTAAGGAVTIEAEDVAGGRSGIRAEHLGTGALSITAGGTVTGGTSEGIFARIDNAASGADLTISAMGVDGGTDGIDAKNLGSGGVTVTTSGPVTADGDGYGIRVGNFVDGSISITANDTVSATGGTGIAARNYFGATDNVTISAAGVTGTTGIVANNSGSGSVSVTATGTVTGTAAFGAGITALNSSGTDITISTAGVIGGSLGITSRNTGTGSTVIDANGAVTGLADNGINAYNAASGSAMTIETVAVSGYTSAIRAENRGTGFLSITTAGAVTGGNYGISADNRGGGDLSITAGGTAAGTARDGIRARNFAGGDRLTISAASVIGGGYGIFAKNEGTDDLSVTTTGLVSGGLGDGIFAWNYNGGALNVTATDTVVSTGGEGIYANNFVGTTSLTISAAGVSAKQYGIIGRNEGIGDFTVVSTGLVTSTIGAGIFAENLNGGAINIHTKDTVESIGSNGISARNLVDTTDLTIVAAGISAGKQAIDAFNEGTGDLSITTTGPATGGAYGGIVARNLHGGALGITAMDTVTATQGDGMYAYNGVDGTTLTISAAGVSGSYHGIAARNLGSGDLTVLTEGPVEGGTRDGMYLRNANGGALSVMATGDVSSTEVNGIRAINYAGGSSMTISTAGVSGFNGGISATNAGTGDMAVTATGEVSGGPLGDGMRVRNLFGGSLSITTTELVSSGLTPVATGIFAENRAGGTDLSISSTDVFGNWNGIVARHYGTGDLSVASTGSVTGATGVGIRAYTVAVGSDLTLSVASVAGGIDAIQVDHKGTGDLLVTVTGTVIGGTGAGINNIDTYAQGGTIVVTETASLSAASGVATTDGNGGMLLSSRGALAGDVLMNGGEDEVALIDGSATGLIGLGGDDDTLEIFGAGTGGGWDDADFSGTFDNNLGQVLQIDGGAGIDTAELFGVTAASQALGVPTGLEALALSNNTLLQANNADLVPFGAVFIDPTSTLQAEGNSPSDTVVGSLGNEGVVDLADGEANDTLTVEGDYAGAAGSQVWLDLDADEGASDTLFILGDVTDVAVGPFAVTHDRTALNVTLTGRGGRAPGNGIQLVEVSGAVGPDDFFLTGPVEAGIFGYELIFEDGQFLLRSDFFEQIYAYESLPGALQTIGLSLTGQLVERVGVRSGTASTLVSADGNPVAGGQPVDTALWARAVGLSVESEGDLDSATGGSFEQTVSFVQGGGEIVVSEGASGRLLIGALGHWGTSSQDLTDIDGAAAGSTDIDFYGGGLTATWYGTGGLYVDGVVQYTAYDIDINPASRFSSVGTDGYGISASGEVGYRIPISATAALVPQAQLTYQHLDFDDFVDPDGVRIALDDGDSLVGRLGLAFENSAAIGSALVTGYAEANVLHEFLGDNSVNATAGGDRFGLNQDLGGTSVEVGFGGTVAVSRGVSLYGEIDYTIPLDNGVQGFQALAGVRINLNPAPPPPPPAPDIVVVNDIALIVFFDWDSAALTPDANLVLDDVVMMATEYGSAAVRLDGYTDLSGSAAYNLGLSERRANSVADGLIARGIAPDEIVIRAFGEENPLVPTPDGVREPQNRRVEIFLS